jgi:hypothetical protein
MIKKFFINDKNISKFYMNRLFGNIILRNKNLELMRR